MSSSARRHSFARILVDLNTQYDFLLPSGAMPVANRRDIIVNIRRLMNWARLERLPVISTLEAHRPGESIRGLPPHCIDNSNGQKKLPFTLLPKRVLIHGDNTLDLPHEPFRRYQQMIFTKRHRDFLTNPKADRLVHQLDVGHLVLFGVVGEFCVKAAALGLMARQQRVVVVTDACGYWSAADYELACRQMDAKGAILVQADELISGRADERINSAPRPMAVLDEEDLVSASTAGQTEAYLKAVGNALASRSEPTNAKGNGNGIGHGASHSGTNGKGQGRTVAPGAIPVTGDGWTPRSPAAGQQTDRGSAKVNDSGLVNPDLLAREVRKAVRKSKTPQDLA